MILKEGEIVDLVVGDGLYFPEAMPKGLKAYQLINKRTGIVEFEEVQLAAAWEAFTHFEIILKEVYDAIEGNTGPQLTLVGADEMPPTPTAH